MIIRRRRSDIKNNIRIRKKKGREILIKEDLSKEEMKEQKELSKESQSQEVSVNDKEGRDEEK